MKRPQNSDSLQNSDVIQDLKDFITATVRGELTTQLQPVKEDVAELKEDVTELKDKVERLDSKVEGLDRKIEGLSGDVAEAISVSNDDTDVKLSNHEKRISRLEARTA